MQATTTHETNLQACIEACEEAIHAAQACAAADIREGGDANCALINLDCADICSATMNALARCAPTSAGPAPQHVQRMPTSTHIVQRAKQRAKPALRHVINTPASVICKKMGATDHQVGASRNAELSGRRLLA
jgi:hypothetical protein